jgi:lysophospholipase L1-like esterase
MHQRYVPVVQQQQPPPIQGSSRSGPTLLVTPPRGQQPIFITLPRPLPFSIQSPAVESLKVAEHIVLFGDSIIDNARYIPMGAPSVVTQLERAVAGRGWKVTRLAFDGAIMEHVKNIQVPQTPTDATVMVLSVGGNNGLQTLARLKAEFWTTLTSFFQAFRLEYETLLDYMLDTVKNVPLIVCTIYYPQFPQWIISLVSYAGLRILNRIIRSCAQARNIPVLDLWTIFSRREDYANVIEPGVPGGAKIVRNLLFLLDDKNKDVRNRYALYDDATHDDAYEKYVHFDEKRFTSSSSSS